MATTETIDEQQGRAEQLPLPLSPEVTTALAMTLRAELDLITDEEFANAVGLATQTLNAWRSEGTGPAYVKLGRSVFYRRSTLREWIDQNTRQPATK